VRVIGYIRVSTVGQVQDGQGLAIQERAIRSWVEEHKHRLVGVHRDEGVSGSVEEREGLEEALAAVRFNGADGLVVSSIDRLARSLTVQEAALVQVWNAGGKAFAVDQGEVLEDDPDDPMRTFIRQVLGAVSQLEAAMITRRLRRGREHKAANGGYAHGAPPFGYRAEGGELVPDPDEQEAVNRITELRRVGNSYRQIVDELKNQGIPPKRGDRWHPMGIKRITDRTTVEAPAR
jgi:DNA invertase Pin-like site-specific DNA recombinase